MQNKYLNRTWFKGMGSFAVSASKYGGVRMNSTKAKTRNAKAMSTWAALRINTTVRTQKEGCLLNEKPLIPCSCAIRSLCEWLASTESRLQFSSRSPFSNSDDIATDVGENEPHLYS